MVSWIAPRNREESLWPEGLNRHIPSPLLQNSTGSFGTLPVCERAPAIPKWFEPRSSCWLTNIPIGTTGRSPAKWVAPTERYGCGVTAGTKWPASKRLLGLAARAFFPSVQRAQITALACTLPTESGRPLSRWSSSELAKEAIHRGIVLSIASSTIRDWLRAERIKPWQHHSWQKPTDPEFLKKATVALNLYARARTMAHRGEIVVCADEKTCIQALTNTGGVMAAGPGKPVRAGARYKRQGILTTCSRGCSSTPERRWRAASPASGSWSSRISSR